MEDKIQEYKMLRQEILQYLEEYQSVRNMMYLITATILGFSLNKENVMVYTYLLPLAVILPSYLISVDYLKCVIKAATYLYVFYEEEAGCPYKWEHRLRKWNENSKIMAKINYQSMPYFVCSIICIGLYFLYLDLKSDYVQMIIGLVVTFVVILVFFIYRRRIDERKSIEEWKRIKKEELEMEKKEERKLAEIRIGKYSVQVLKQLVEKKG